MYRVIIISAIVLAVIIGLSIPVTRFIIKAKMVQKQAFIESLFQEFNSFPIKQKDAYRFDLSIEISKYNAELAYYQYLDKTILKVWIPEIVNNKIEYHR